MTAAARRSGMQGKRIPRGATLGDVASQARVSLKTASRVVNDEGGVRPKTRALVLAACEALDYVPDLAARQLRAGRAFQVGLVIHPLAFSHSPSFLAELQKGLLPAAAEAGKSVSLILTELDEAEMSRLVGLVRGRSVDGLILSYPFSEWEPLLERLADVGVPHVCVTSKAKAGCPSIEFANVGCAHEMTRYLLSLGHRRIAMVRGFDWPALTDRFEGYARALAEEALEPDPSLLRTADATYETGLEAGRGLLVQRDRPSAILAANDAMALGVLRAAYELGLRVPQDLSVAGFDDVPTARQIAPALTTVRLPIRRMASVAAELLNTWIEHGEPAPEAERHVELPARLIIRESTGPPAANV